MALGQNRPRSAKRAGVTARCVVQWGDGASLANVVVVIARYARQAAPAPISVASRVFTAPYCGARAKTIN